MLYHASPIEGLKILEPHVSTHKVAYVYAIEKEVTALIFGVKQDDFDFIINEENDIPVIYECYPNAFQNIYMDKSCSLYEVNDEGFLAGITSWESEYVCKDYVNVVSERQIEDLYSCLLDYAKKGELEIHMYEQTPKYRSMISKHIVDRLIRFEIDLHNCLQWKDSRFKIHYENLIIPLAKILEFCKVARTKKEISEYIGYKNLTYMTRTFIKPLIESGQLLYTIPEKPQSRLQKYIRK